MRAFLIAGLALALSGGAAMADPWKDESGKGKWRGGNGGYERYGGYEGRGGYGRGWDDDRKMKMRTADGCEVERKWKKGEYEEKVKCKPGRYGSRW
jgi:hypothetical protein